MDEYDKLKAMSPPEGSTFNFDAADPIFMTSLPEDGELSEELQAIQALVISNRNHFFAF
tara:strand:- start:41 stop:217 length:177 start_codon:yes stop_codon:yes gene_type:complete